MRWSNYTLIQIWLTSLASRKASKCTPRAASRKISSHLICHHLLVPQDPSGHPQGCIPWLQRLALVYELNFSKHFVHSNIVLSKCVAVVVQSLRHVQLFETPWTAVHQVPRSLGTPRLRYWCSSHVLPQRICPQLGDGTHWAPWEAPASVLVPEVYMDYRSPGTAQRRREWQPAPVLLPGEPQGRRSLLGCRVGSQSRTRLKRLSSSGSSIAQE